MHSSGAVKKVKSQEQQARLSAAEMKIVQQARAESRKEVAELDQMKYYARRAFLSNPDATEEEFECCWPELRNDMFRHAHHGMTMWQQEWRGRA